MEKQYSPERARLLARYQQMGLEAKIRYAERLIEAALLTHTHPVVACSFGKDSMVLLHLVRQLHPSIEVVFNNTLIEFPETLRFARRIEEEWNLKVHWVRPQDKTPEGRLKDFWWCVETYGWPAWGKEATRTITSIQRGKRDYEHRRSNRMWKLAQSGVKFSDKCCYWLKKKPCRRFYAQHKVDCVFQGILAEESHRRRLNWIHQGDWIYPSKERHANIFPLSIWKESDIWEYIRREKLPYNPLYDMGYKRTGCWPCTMDLAADENRLKLLRQTHPKMFHFLIVEKGLGEALIKMKYALHDGQRDLFSHTWDLETLLKMRPCFFDRIVV